MTDVDVSVKRALRGVNDAVTELVTAIAREGARPLVVNEHWVILLDNRYFVDGEMEDATISAIAKHNQPDFITEMLVDRVYRALNAPEVVYTSEDGDEDF